MPDSNKSVSGITGAVHINQIDQVTQQNAALAEQASAAADSMREQSAGLATVVSLFKLDDRTALVHLDAAEMKS